MKLNDNDLRTLNELVNQLTNKENVMFFVGAGLSLGSGLPSWEELVIRLGQDFGINVEDPIPDAHADGKGERLQQLAQQIEKAAGSSRKVVEKINKYFDEIKPVGGYSVRLQRMLIRIVARTSGVIFTTNYDRLLEKAAEEEGVKYKVFSYPDLLTDDFSYLTGSGRAEQDGCLYIYKIHGSLENDRVVLSNSSYEEAYRKKLYSVLTILSQKNMFFLGCSFTDNYFGTEYREDIGTGHWYTYYPLSISTKEVENYNIKSQNIKVVGYIMDDMSSSLEHNGNIEDLFDYLTKALALNAAVPVRSMLDVATIGINGAIKNVELTKELLDINNWSLESLTNIEEVICCSDIKNIPNHAFCNCRSLKRIVFKSNVVAIGDQAFDGCNNLKEIVTPSGVNKFTALSRLGNMVFNNCVSLEMLEFEDSCSLNHVPAHCFQGCINLAYIRVPSGIVEIGASAFYNCRSLKHFNFSVYEKLKSIKIRAFVNCDALQEALLGDSVNEIGEGAFQDCEHLQVVRIPRGLKVVSRWCFADCCSLESLTMMYDSTIKTIESQAFRRCSILNHVEFPKTLEEIKANAFLSCVRLNDVRFNSKPRIQDSAFDGSGFKV